MFYKSFESPDGVIKIRLVGINPIRAVYRKVLLIKNNGNLQGIKNLFEKFEITGQVLLRETLNVEGTDDFVRDI